MPQLGVPIRRARGRGKRVQLINAVDFTGGLHLETDQFRLAETESPDLLNVDVGQRGGFRQRRPVDFVNGTDLAGDPRNVWAYATSGGVNQIMVNVGDTVLYSTGANFTDCTIGAGATTGPFRAITFTDLCYIQRYAEQVPVKWDGSADTSLTANAPTWQEDVAAPIGGYMPKAKCIAAHGGYAWVANTVENGTAYKNRVRWSHPNRPEDWRSTDYIDIDVGVDGDEITALVPFSDHLLVFKRLSVHAIFGYDVDSFQVVAVDQHRGTPTQESVVATPAGVFFFSWPEGVYHYSGKGGGEWIFDKLWPAIRDGDIPDAYVSKVALGWGNNRLWVSVPWGASTTRARTFVFDPATSTRKSSGAWVAYDLATGPYHEWQQTGGTVLYTAGCVGTNKLLKLEQDGASDDFGDGDVPIDSYFRTAWFADGQPAIRKRWKRPDVVLHDENTNNAIRVHVFRDYDPSTYLKVFDLNTEAGTEMVWGSAWGSAVWGADGTRNVIDRGSNLGSARAVSLKFFGSDNLEWGVEAIAFKYLPKAVR